MVADSVRTQVVLPRELVEQVDELVGRRRRSEFLAEALREKLKREQQAKVFRESAGILDPADHPEWRTPEDVSAWVRKLRREADESTSSLSRTATSPASP